MIQPLVGGLSEYSNLITALATAVLAVLTAVLWFENRRLRKAGSSPEIVAYLVPHPDGNGGVQFVLANVGRGPAFNLSFELQHDQIDFAKHRALLENDPQRKSISVVPQGEELRALLGVGFELYGKVGSDEIGPLKPFEVKLTCFDVFGAKIVRTCLLDIRQFAGLRGILSKSNALKATESLGKIESHLAAIAKQSSRFSAFVDTTEIGDNYTQKKKGSSKR